MMFKGTKKYPDGQFDKLLEEAGAEGKNAFTSRDYTAYIQELPKSQLPLIIDIESDRMSHLVVDEKSFSTEREVVHNERRFRNENSPDGLMYQEIFGLAFEKHSYRWPIIGMEEDLNAMTAQDARDFYQAHYAPNFATIVVVGDVIAQDVYHQIKRAYGSIPRSDRPQTRPPIEPPQTSMKRKTLKLNVQAEKLMVAYRVPELSHPDVPALSLLRAILTDGKSGRLKRALIHTGVASDADGYDLDDQDPSLMIFFANLQQGRSAVEAETIMLKELEKMQKSLVAEKELQRALSQIKFQFYLGLGDAKAKARTLGHYESIFGDFRLVERILAQMEKVTPADIQRVAQTYFKPDLRNVVLGVGK
jgi:zinc protease